MLDFSIKPKITKEFILSYLTQETIASHYLGYPVTTKKLYRSPFRSDKCPTCSYYKSRTGVLYFHDFATNQQYNCFNIVMEMYNCDFYKSLEIIAKDFGLILGEKEQKPIFEIIPEIKQKETTLLQIEEKDFSESELEWWKSYGITPKILKKYNVYSAKSVFLDGKIVAMSSKNHPIFGYYGGTQDNLELWRIYFPKRKNYRFMSNWSSSKIQGIDQLPKSGKVLVITKSMKDVMTLASLGIPAIAPNSETLFVDEETLSQLRSQFKYVFVVYDNDRPGKYNMLKIRRNHPELEYFFIPNKYGAKDISDFYKKYGREETIKFIKKYLTKWQQKRVRP